MASKKKVFCVFCLGALLFAVLASPVPATAQDAQGEPAITEDAPPPLTSGTTATVTGSETGLAVPRFVSLRSDKIHVRSGPGMRYPIRWVYQRANLPVEIVQEFDTWRKIRDNEGQEGWVHQSLVSGRRHVMVSGTDIVFARAKPDIDTAPVFRMEPGVVAELEDCNKSWCHVAAGGFDGWVEKKSIWGIYPSEGIN